MLAGRPHEAAGNGSPRWMTAAPRERGTEPGLQADSPPYRDVSMVIVAREPDGRWYVTFTLDTAAPQPLGQTGRAAGVDLGVKDFAVTSDGQHWTCPSCRARHDRDINAAKNILAAGLAVSACGVGVRHPGTPRG